MSAAEAEADVRGLAHLGVDREERLDGRDAAPIDSLQDVASTEPEGAQRTLGGEIEETKAVGAAAAADGQDAERTHHRLRLSQERLKGAAPHLIASWSELSHAGGEALGDVRGFAAGRPRGMAYPSWCERPATKERQVFKAPSPAEEHAAVKDRRDLDGVEVVSEAIAATNDLGDGAAAKHGSGALCGQDRGDELRVCEGLSRWYRDEGIFRRRFGVG